MSLLFWQWNILTKPFLWSVSRIMFKLLFILVCCGGQSPWNYPSYSGVQKKNMADKSEQVRNLTEKMLEKIPRKNKMLFIPPHHSESIHFPKVVFFMLFGEVKALHFQNRNEIFISIYLFDPWKKNLNFFFNDIYPSVANCQISLNWNSIFFKRQNANFQNVKF